MRTSLKERIISSLFVGVFLFITLCVIHKLFIGKADWLSYSLVWSIAWTIGHFVSKTITTMEESIWKILGYDLIIIVVAFILLAFVLGVLCDMASWGETVSNIMVSFGMSMIVNNKWIRD